MTIQDKINQYSIDKLELQKQSKALQNEFAIYITDKSIPLIERWGFFINADNDFKIHQDYIFTAIGPGLKYINDNYFNAPERYGRGKRVYFDNLLGECYYDEQFHYENFDYTLTDDDAKELLEDALEEILSKNLGSFCFDW